MNHSDRLRFYELCVEGHIRADWFEGASVQETPAGETLVSGAFDQAALHGLLGRIRDLGLVLLAVRSRPAPALPAGARG